MSRRPTFRTFAIALLAVPLLAPHLKAQLAPPSADAYTSFANRGSNYGTRTSLNVYSGSTSYLQFNLAPLPAGATVAKATLRLFVTSVTTSGSFDVYQVNNTWTEGGLTYNNAPGLGSSATGVHPVSLTSANVNQFVIIDVTSLVQDWLDGSTTNHGLALQLQGVTGSFTFDSKEAIDSSHEPELEIALNGPPGPQGPQGQTGLTGGTGPEGPAGPVGPQGPKGDIGPMGPQGLKGDTGAVGPQGPEGPQGLKGETGAAGPQGEIGPIGPQGSKGDVGPIGPQGPKGDIGAVGPQGPEGPQGLKGETGAAGPQGEIGPIGPQGSKGDMGAVGPQGPEGPQGLKGEIGLAGPQGPEGPQGPKGDTGAVGPIGLPGAIGATGPQGAQGPMGPIGPIGPQGPAGPSGNAGFSGTANAIPVYTGATTLGSSPIIVNGENVGIGGPNNTWDTLLAVAPPGGGGLAAVGTVDPAVGNYTFSELSLWAKNPSAPTPMINLWDIGNEGYYSNNGTLSGQDMYFYNSRTGTYNIAVDASDNVYVGGNSYPYAAPATTVLYAGRNGNVGIGTTTPRAKLEIKGGLRFSGDAPGVVQTTAWTGVLSGGDYAEAVNVRGPKSNYEPGDVLVIGENGQGEVEKSSLPYSTMVSGIYATKPGVIGRRQSLDAIAAEEVPMGMIGIVPTKVTTENGAIHKGDLLVTSSVAGYAMKGTDRTRMLGAVIGKALADLETGRGVIEVLVTLQ